MIGVLFATVEEAQPFLNLGRAVPLDATPLPLYEIGLRPAVMVAVSGAGKVAAAIACQMLIREYQCTRVINAGACGALKADKPFQPGSIYGIDTVLEGDYSYKDKAAQTLSCPRAWRPAKLPAARLVTCDQPVFDQLRRAALAATADLVDMEGAAVARVAELFNTPWTLIKGVTDTAGPGDRQSLQRNLPLVCGAMAKVVWQEISESQ
jgi:adenosylhomocysteine nucleosidase